MTDAERKAEEEEEGFRRFHMKLSCIEKKENKMTLLLEDSTPAYTNTLRRLMMSHVPTMAIEDVEFRQNSSALYDEMIAHRLGLTVLTTDLKSYVLPSECKCEGEGCARCSLKLTLKAKGPKTVYASDIKTTDPKVKPVYPKTLIVKLLKDQVLEFEATAVLGKGIEHTKWSPGHIFFKTKPEIKIDQKKIENAEAIAAVCPVNIYKADKGKLSLVEENVPLCHYCRACTDASEGISINDEEKDYMIYVESWGQLKPKQIVEESLNILDSKLDEFKEKIK